MHITPTFTAADARKANRAYAAELRRIEAGGTIDLDLDLPVEHRFCSFCDDHAVGHRSTWSWCPNHRSAAIEEVRQEARTYHAD